MFNPTDVRRLDGHKSHISCSIEYPNSWYFVKAEGKEPLFPDWVVLSIIPDYIWQDGTLFCPRNAAADYGRLVQGGLTGFESLFAESAVGSYGKTFTRSPRRLRSCPTDEQAEVLVLDRIPLEDIEAVIVRDTRQAKNEAARLEYAGCDPASFHFMVAPVLFQPYELSAYLARGERPPEVPWP